LLIWRRGTLVKNASLDRKDVFCPKKKLQQVSWFSSFGQEKGITKGKDNE
jgi:hypothetical protein